MHKNLGKKEIFSLVFVCLVMPAAIVYFALDFWDQTRLELQKNLLLNQTESLTARLFFHSDNARFWAHTFNQACKKEISGKEFKRTIDKLSRRFRQKFAYAIWPVNEKMMLNFPASKKLFADWQKVLPIVNKAFVDPGGSHDDYKDQFLRRLIGPHFFICRINEARGLQKPRFVESDFRMKYPLVWAGGNEKMTALIMVSPSIMAGEQGIKEFCRDLNEDKNPAFSSFAVVKNAKVFGNSPFNREQIQRFRQRMNAQGQRIIVDSGIFICGDELEDGSSCFVFAPLQKIEVGRATALCFVLQLFLALVLMRTRAFARIFTQMRVARSIFLLVGLSNVLPLFFLLFFSEQYLIQKRMALLDGKRAEAIKFIQLLEQKFENEISRFPQRALQTIQPFIPALKKGRLRLADARYLNQQLKMQNLNFHLVASSTGMSLSDDGYFLGDKYYDLRIRKRDDHRRRTADIFRKIVSAYLGYWNGIPISGNDLTETELVVELLFQKPLDEALHMFVEMNERVSTFGFGTEGLPSFARVFSFFSANQGDFFAILQKNRVDSAQDFLENNRRDRLANDYGFKLVYCSGRKGTYIGIAPFKDLPAVEKLLFDLKKYPPVSTDIVELEGRQYLCTGYISSVIKNYSLMALYPVLEIEKKLALERRDLFALFAMNLLLVLALTYFFSAMLFVPVQKLENCTRQIVAGNYSFRIDDLGNDEMGRMGQVLNEALADLEELGVARLVQQQLFPQGQLPVPPFSLFGKSVTLADLGGDYFDYFKTSERRFAVLLGDVAGHGVGAAMIMAMAKSATLNSRDLCENPVAFLQRLHQIVYLSKTRKQRKIMTMQYLCVDQTRKTLIYANAGGCNPFIINGKTGRAEEISLPGPVLGAFKKSVFNEVEIAFEEGDVMVLYTDGIAEARNDSGQEIGFSGLKEMLQKSYSADPEEFYHLVYEEYCAWLGSAPPQDDLTMIFLALNSLAKQ